MSPDRTRRQGKVVAANALLIVRAEVADPADRPHFDRWYNEEHLRDALATFQAVALVEQECSLPSSIRHGGIV
jgi:hypothetical protein